MKLSLLSILILAAVPALSAAAPTVWGFNDHAYDLIQGSTGLPTYEAAKAAAEASSFRGVQGHLAILDTADYSAEFTFVRDSIVRPSATGAGGSAGTGYWVGTSRPNAEGNLRENWTWDDGTTVPTSVTNSWNLDVAEGNVPYGGFFYSADTYGTIWDYAKSDPGNFSGGYVVEYAAPVPEPATMAALGLGAAALLRRRRRKSA